MPRRVGHLILRKLSIRHSRRMRWIVLASGTGILLVCWFFLLKIDVSQSSLPTLMLETSQSKPLLDPRVSPDTGRSFWNMLPGFTFHFKIRDSIKEMLGKWISFLKSLLWIAYNGDSPSHVISAENDGDFPFRYLINERDTCGKNIKVINIIPIAANNVRDRLRIRDLWGSKFYSDITGMKTLFLLGTSDSSFSQIHIETESKLFHDIIQLDFKDSYWNLTFKTLSLLHWTKHYCPSANWILKSNDDVLVNPFSLTKLLQEIEKGTDFACYFNEDPVVCREGDECNPRFAVSYNVYPYATYPPYCEGPAYVISTTMAETLYRVANKTHLFPMEDVYFTGMIVQPFDPIYFHLDDHLFPSHKSLFRSRSKLFTLILLHLENSKMVSYELWNRILHYYKIPKPNKPSPSDLWKMKMSNDAKH